MASSELYEDGSGGLYWAPAPDGSVRYIGTGHDLPGRLIEDALCIYADAPALVVWSWDKVDRLPAEACVVASIGNAARIAIYPLAMGSSARAYLGADEVMRALEL